MSYRASLNLGERIGNRTSESLKLLIPINIGNLTKTNVLGIFDNYSGKVLIRKSHFRKRRPEPVPPAISETETDRRPTPVAVLR